MKRGPAFAADDRIAESVPDDDMADAPPLSPRALQRRVEKLAGRLVPASLGPASCDSDTAIFLAMVTHELRTPLNAVTGFSEAALHGIHGPLPEAYRSYFAAINGVGRHLGALVESLLDLAQIEAGRFAVTPGAISARAVVEEAVTIARPLAERQGVDLAAAGLAEDWTLYADGTRVRQILVNLLANAVKFTPPDGEVGIDAEAGDGLLDLTVWDTGLGIADEHQPRIFDAFYQLHARPLGNRGTGVGLGLAIARQLAAAMAGDILLSSELGRGSRFTLRLPLAPPEPGPG